MAPRRRTSDQASEPPERSGALGSPRATASGGHGGDEVPPFETMITVGRIVRPHGIKGAVLVESESDFAAERFAKGAELFWQRDGQTSAVQVRGGGEHQGRWLVSLTGIESMNDAEVLRGLELRVPAEALHELKAGEFYVHDLEGCEVVTEAGQIVGRVTGVNFGSGTPVLAVEGKQGEILIPLAEEICRIVDPAGKRIVIDPPAGLIELNAKRERVTGRETKAADLMIDIITIFPRLVEAALAEGVVARAREAGVIDVKARDLREFTADRHRTVDDVPFGGGPGMVMKAEPIARAIEAVAAERGPASAVILMTPQGRQFTQAEAERLSRLERLVVICGRYEGVDERLTEALVTDELSIGDYVLTGGELAALVVVDAVARLAAGVVGDARSVAQDSFSDGYLDHPHYTRPAVWRDRAVPEVLMSGHHGEIEKWRSEQRAQRTEKRRPDLLRTDLKERGNEGD
jgi:tRNA (guanine37-N1)-methyltransferase